MKRVWEVKKKGRVYFNLFLCLLCAFLFFLMIICGFYFLVWICLVPGFFILQRGDKYGTNKTVYSLYALFIGFLISLSFYWLRNYKIEVFYLAIFVICLFAFSLGLFGVLLNKKIKSPILRIFFFPVFWLILLLAFSNFTYGNMWLRFAYFAPMMYPLGFILQPILYSVFIILFNSLVANYLVYKNKKVLYVILVFGVLIVSSVIYSNYASIDGREVNVLLVQGMVGHEWTWRMRIADEVLTKYENLTLSVKDEKIDIIVWPEYAIPADFEINESLKLRVENLAKEMNSYIVLGSFSYLDKSKIGFFDLKYDRALVFSPEGDLIDYSDSKGVISLKSDIVSSNESAKSIETNEFEFNIGLCFEEYMDIGNLGLNSGDIIIIAANNYQFDNGPGLLLISQFSKLKALEKNKYVLRSSNSGYTQIINPHGKTVARLKPYESGVLTGKIYI